MFSYVFSISFYHRHDFKYGYKSSIVGFIQLFPKYNLRNLSICQDPTAIIDS